MTRLQFTILAKWAFIVWVLTWLSFAFFPKSENQSQIASVLDYSALLLWIVSYWTLHVSLAKGKGYFASTGIGYAFFPIIGLIFLVLKTDKPS